MEYQGDQVPDDVDEDDKRLYECARKYEILVKQFDELVGLLKKNGTSAPKWPKGRRGNDGSAKPAVSSSNPNNNEAIVKTVTRFLNELSASPTDPECSRST